jgi:hypothetical protein
MTLDIEKAREEGYTDEDIAPILSKEQGFDYTKAIQERYTPTEIVDYLMTKPKSGEELAKEASTIPEKVTDYLFSEQEPQDTSLGRVVAGGVSGGVTGAAIGKFFGPKGAVAGGVSGVAAGVSSSILGEISRAAGNSRATTFALEFAGGGVPTWLHLAGSKVLNPAYLKGTPVLESISNMIQPRTFKDAVTRRAKQYLFGKDTISGTAITANMQNTQNQLRAQYDLFGDSEQLVSTILRKRMLLGIDKAGKGTTPKQVTISPSKPGLQQAKTAVVLERNVFANSPEFKSLQNTLNILKERGRIRSSDIAEVNRVVGNAINKNKDVADKSAEDILNFIQNKGLRESKQLIDGKPVTETAITSATQKELRLAFDTYLQRNSDEITYNALKEAERLEFGAAAADSIPTLIASRFKTGTKEVEEALRNIQNFDGGKEMLINAINTHFKQFGTKLQVGNKEIGGKFTVDELMSEWFRIYPMLEKLQVLPKKEIIALSRKMETTIRKIPKTMRNQGTKEFIATSIRQGLAGSLASEAAASETATSTKNRAINKIFSL